MTLNEKWLRSGDPARPEAGYEPSSAPFADNTGELITARVLRNFAYEINVILAAFNLLPIPPLDGSAVVERLLPGRLLPAWRRMARYAMPLLLLLVLLLPGALGRLFAFARDLWFQLL